MEQNIIELGFDMSKFTPQQKEVLVGLNEVYKAAEKIDGLKIGPGVSPSWKALKDAIAAQSLEIKKLENANMQYVKAQEALTKAETAQIVQLQQKERLAQQELKTKKALAAESNASAAASAKEAKIIDQLTNEYLQLNKAYNDAVLRYRNLFLVKGEDAEVTKKQLKTVNDYRAILDKMDKNLNIHSRNVGNYSSAFNGLGMSIQQVGRELPTLAINFQMFALAISNNLPILADELSRAKTEIAALQAEGKAAPTLFQQIGKSIFSWQTALTIGITLFTIYAKEIGEFVEQIFDADAGLKKFNETQRERNKLLVENNKLANANLTNTEYEVGLYDESIKGMEKELAVMKASGKSKADIMALENKIADQREFNARKVYENTDKLGQLANAQQDLENARIKMQVANVQLSRDVEDKKLKEKQEIAQKELDIAQSNYDAQLKVVDDYANAVIDKKTKLTEREVFIEEEKAKIVLDSITNEANMQIALNEVVLNNERSTEKQRLAAVKSTFDEREKIRKAELAYATSRPGAFNADGTATADTAQAIKKDNEEKLNNLLTFETDSFNITESYRKRNLAAESAMFKNKIAIQDEFAKNLLARETASIQDRLAAQDQLVKDQVKLEEDRYKMVKDRAGRTNTEIKADKKEHETNMTLIEMRATIARIELIRKLSLEAAQQTNNLIEVDNLETLANDYRNLVTALEQKKITLKQFDEQRRLIDKNYTDDSLRDQLDLVKKQIEIEKNANRDTTALQKQQANIEMQIEKNKLDEAARNAKTKLEREKELRQKLFELAQETINLVETLVMAQYTREIERLQELMELKAEYYAQEMENVKNSTLSEEDKARRLKVLEADAAASRKKSERDIREQKTRMAKAEKAFQIMQIIGNTAMAISKAVAEFPITGGQPFASIAAAIGAVQVATVLATPIPKYADGTDNHPGGLAVYGEAGPEVVKEPGKNPYLVDQATLGMLPKGTKVTPMDEVNQHIMNSMLKGQGRFMNRDSAVDDWAIARWQTNRLEKAFNKVGKRPVRVNVTTRQSLDVNKSFGR